MSYLLLLFLQLFFGLGATQKPGLYVTGKNNESYRVDGYSSYKIYLDSIKALLSDKIRDTYEFALQYSDSTPSALFTQTTPDKLVFLELIHSFDMKNTSFTNFLLNVANLCTFSSPKSFQNWINNNFNFPSEKIYQIIKYIASTKPALHKAVTEHLYFLSNKYNIFEKAATTGDAEIVKWLFVNSQESNKAVELTTVEEIWKNGKVDIIELLMEFKKLNKQNLPQIIVNERFKNKETFLHIASRCGYVDAVNILITNLGANMNSKDIFGKSPLYRAVENNKPKVVESLVAKNADISSEALVALAVQKGHTETIKTLLTLGVPLNKKDQNGDAPFFIAAKKNDVKILEILSSIDGPKKVTLNSTDEFGDTLMHVAASKGFINFVKSLAKLGALIDSKNNFGETPLYKAIESKNLEIFDFLLKSGANIKTITDHGDTILHLAASLGNFEIIKLLLSKKFHFPINVRNSYGETPVYMAAVSGKCDILKFLVKNGGDLNTNNNGKTMLHEAAAAGNEKAVICLIDSGINIDVPGLWDSTPLHLAVSHGHETIVKKLLEKKANPNTKTKNLWTPLHRAVLTHNRNIITDLIKYGADITAKNGAGDTPYVLAIKQKHTKSVEVLHDIIKNL